VFQNEANALTHETEALQILAEVKPRQGVRTPRGSHETEALRPRPHISANGPPKSLAKKHTLSSRIVLWSLRRSVSSWRILTFAASISARLAAIVASHSLILESLSTQRDWHAAKLTCSTHKVKQSNRRSAQHFITSYSSLRRSGIARVNEVSVYLPTTRLSMCEINHSCPLLPSHTASLKSGRYSVLVPLRAWVAVQLCLSTDSSPTQAVQFCGWLHTKVVCPPKMIIHTSTNQAWHTVWLTLLISWTTLPLHHTATLLHSQVP